MKSLYININKKGRGKDSFLFVEHPLLVMGNGPKAQLVRQCLCPPAEGGLFSSSACNPSKGPKGGGGGEYWTGYYWQKKGK
jgi:hypothetical protein